MPRVDSGFGERLRGWFVTSGAGRAWAAWRDLTAGAAAYWRWRRNRRHERAARSTRNQPAASRPTAQQTPKTIAVLGTGTLGAPVARRLAEAGFAVRAWNRTGARAEPLRTHGVAVCASAAEAATGADALVTLLRDGQVVAEVCAGGALEALPAGALWLQMSTVGVRDCERLRELAERHGVTYIDAPVLGSREPAERGELVVLASGPEAAQARANPLFAPLAARVLWLGEAGAGSRLKVVVNGWLVALVANLAETLALASALDVDHGVLLDLLAQTPVGSPYAGIKGELMRSRSYPVSFALDLAAKDLELVTEARELLALDGHLADATRKLFEQAKEAGLGSFDLSAVYEVCAPAGERRDLRAPPSGVGVHTHVQLRGDSAAQRSPGRAETAEAGGDDAPPPGTLAL